MQQVAIGVVIAAGLGLGTLWPGHKAPVAPAGVTSIVLERASDGHFYADAEVNGATVHFLVDTGATTIALSEADAKKAGIQVAAADYELIGQSASGLVRGKEKSIDHLKLGEIDSQDVKAAVVEGATTSLLGADYLDTMDEITIRKGEMTLRRGV